MFVKSLVISRVTPRSYEQLGIPDRSKPMPDINTDPTSSNIYGVSERILLTWLNYCYSNYREQVWANGDQGNFNNITHMFYCCLFFSSKYAIRTMDC